MKNLFLVSLIMFFTACGPQGLRGRDGVPGPTGPTTPIPPPTPTPIVDEVQNEINLLIEDENDYRLGLGQTTLSNGLSCSIQQVLSGVRISSSSPPGLGAVIALTGNQYTYLYKESFSQPNSSSGASVLIPPNIRPLFVGLNYLIRCQGQLVVLDTDYYQFELSSDDGSILTLDNTVTIMNDGNHGMTTVLGTKFLRRGVHTIKVEYAQSGGGNFGMVLKAGGQLIEPRYYFH